MPQYSANVNIIIKAVEKAGRALIRDFGELENLQTSKKASINDFILISEKKSEKTLKEELERARHEFGYVSKNKGIEIGSTPENLWIINPLDGIENFSHGVPNFVISVAMKKSDHIITSVIYNPITQELYIAERGTGAYLNNRRIRVSNRQTISNSIFATNIPHRNSKDMAQTINEITGVSEHSGSIRSIGTPTLELAYVAAGRLEGCWNRNINIWDIAAGVLLVKEAGGTIDALSNDQEKSILATNGHINKNLKKILTEK